MDKYHKSDIAPIESENERDETYEAKNPQIDCYLTKNNYHTVKRNCSYTEFINKRIEELNLPTKVRKDAVLMASFIFGSDERFFRRITKEQQEQFFKDCTEFIADRYGEENIISAVVHMDETNPHLHLNLFPEYNGRLCAKQLFNQKELTNLQTDIWEKVGKKYGLLRGKKGSQAEHVSTAEYKARKIIEKAEIQAQEITDDAQKELKDINQAVKKAEEHFDVTMQQIQTAKTERDKIVSERNEEADYKQAIEEAKNGNLPHSKNGLKNQVLALTVENKQITEENERLKKDNADLYKEYKDKEAKQMNYDKAIKAISLFQKQEPEAFARVFYRSTSILEPFIPTGSPPAELSRNRLREIEEEIRREQTKNNSLSGKSNYGKAD